MATRYFAYGSNLKTARMCERAPSARPEGIARLLGYRLVWDKRGRDGTGKANLRADANAAVWGVVYRLEVAEWVFLDAHESGYDRLEVYISQRGERLRAHTYLSTLLTTEPVPAAWYQRLVVEGAREHGLPLEWIRSLDSWPAR